MAKVLLISVLLVFMSWCGTHGNEGAFSFHMDDVIRIVEDLERLNPELEILDAVELLRSAGHYDSAYLRLLLGDGMRGDHKPAPSELSQDQTHFISSLLNHKVSGAREEGVVLTPDGTSVAVAPLLIGIEAGLKRKRIALEKVDVLYAASLAKHLALSFVGHHRRQNSERLGPDGCWDDVKTPRVFTLMGDPSPVTDALINGELDGVILGDQLSKEGKKPPVLSTLLKRYYQYGAEEAAGSSPGLQSRFRRRNFAALVSMPVLQKQTVKSFILYRELSSLLPLKDIEGIVREGLQDFQKRYLDCPPVIPRCMWGAQQYRGTPTNLTLPLSFLFIHHTYQPAQPCQSFSQCAADMRSMQRFHQEDRGWDDIGYSFVAGSDGYLYEGRGWQWQGAHTRGHNSKGYGVSFIGDFTSVLPDASALALVRDSFTKCAVEGARLVPSFTVHGHRQVVNTSSPGDALYSEITTWKQFKDVQAPGRKPFELEKQNKSAFSFHMDDVIRIVEDLERLNPELEILDAVELLRSAGHYDSAYLRHLLGDGTRSDRKPAPSELSQDQTHFISSLLNHKVSGAREGGVVLTPDGTSVAVAPLLVGIEAGLKRKMLALESVDVLYAASLAKHLALSFVGHHRRQNSERLGPDGCWDDVKTPRVFTLMGDPSPVTDALINGALDGVILGDQLSKEGKPPVLSALLKRYYQYRVEAAVGSSPGLQSRFRRRNFAALVSMPVLQEQTVKSLILYQELSSLPPLKDIGGIVREGLQDFQQRFLDCPPVIPRCMWGAQPYRGTPTNLTLPLSFLYIHHTHQPAQPCTSFSQCAADMRSMQSFHQEDRGWHDIGYSFVAGSDGYLYEGRGWEWQGAHTKRHNSKGYGVSFIGDFTSVLPDASTLALVRDSFTKCAVQGARLVPDFTVHGHRQVVRGVSCPGDALHSEIRTWKHQGSPGTGKKAL
ncbi:hypothetical protein AOXY_G29464 [Acipenser oxyrinchus oxyrinchus]|uniref:Peptidoglycan recognition protein 2 n=1 Tax=Acipenser oxyrinchus oxyrinchus TaxID=40147 RepID=A0AAD8CMI4_ACIOX|nr:hypothetical protein AOXY_G29464 [Acipenser oxyrinchus oxyrinchus]